MCGDDHTAGVEDGTVFDCSDHYYCLQSQWWRNKLVADGTALLAGLERTMADIYITLCVVKLTNSTLW